MDRGYFVDSLMDTMRDNYGTRFRLHGTVTNDRGLSDWGNEEYSVMVAKPEFEVVDSEYSCTEWVPVIRQVAKDWAAQYAHGEFNVTIQAVAYGNECYIVFLTACRTQSNEETNAFIKGITE